MVESDGFRIDPAPLGIHLVNMDDGGRWVHIPFDRVDEVINLLLEVKL